MPAPRKIHPQSILIKYKIWFVPVLVGSVFFILFLKTFLSVSRVCFKKRCISVESATTDEQRMRGLMFRNYLGKDQGMLFVFPGEDFWNFWMKNTNIALDIIWMDKNRKVVQIVQNAKPTPLKSPPVIRAIVRAQYVLEVNAGFVQENKIKVGDEARFKWIFSAKAL